jgi:hypothetical protein
MNRKGRLFQNFGYARRKKAFVKADQSRTTIRTEIPNIKDSRIEVNISELTSAKRGRNSSIKRAPEDDLQSCLACRITIKISCKTLN